jgi:hypothetical protein
MMPTDLAQIACVTVFSPVIIRNTGCFKLRSRVALGGERVLSRPAPAL